VGLLALLIPVLAGAAEVRAAEVRAVEDGATLTLGDGRLVRLAGLESPALPAGWKPRRWPPAEQARAALTELALGRTVTLDPGEGPPDRWGRLAAQVTRADGLWLQGEMLARGWARVHTRADERQRAFEMLAREEEARAAGRGLWSERSYAIRTPETLEHDLDSFQLVQGRILTTQSIKGRLYLNFGPDWRTDFTVVIPLRVWRTLPEAATDPATLAGRTLRVRGWVYRYNGPVIELDHPEALQWIASLP
jgi:endonuclease YncB( thermonuclease family)